MRTAPSDGSRRVYIERILDRADFDELPAGFDASTTAAVDLRG
jgi:hypothetical protein